MGTWPEPKSVLVMDNASFHHTERIKQMYYDASVKLVYLPPYSLNFNLIKEFFAPRPSQHDQNKPFPLQTRAFRTLLSTTVSSILRT
jgi:hypothetical protein